MTQTKETLLLNLMFQILKNQTDSINGIMTHELYEESNKLKKDCLAFINKSAEEKKPVVFSKEEKEDVNTVFNYWKNPSLKGWHKHTKIADHSPAIRVALGEFKLEEILSAIWNYVGIVESDEYYFNHRHTLTRFLKSDKSGLMNFVHSAKPYENYRIYKNGRKQAQQSIISNEEAKHAFNS